MKTVRAVLGATCCITFLLIHSVQVHSELVLPNPLENTLESIQNPQDLVQLMRDHFKFVDDYDLFGTLDYWQSPEEFWASKTGDCEDYALFAKFVLEKKGMEAFVVSLYGPHGYGHTITLYREKERFNVINEDRLYQYESKTVEEALSRVNPQWTWGAFAEQKGTRGWPLRTIKNPTYLIQLAKKKERKAFFLFRIFEIFKRS
ncbi:MAG: transglutaminase-like cysteine peptidase [Candidatus Omnitrophica bacterium]|nr:transglutaminase-like cysteine peptidase [Candidatus Omnitrophota bacterium]